MLCKALLVRKRLSTMTTINLLVLSDHLANRFVDSRLDLEAGSVQTGGAVVPHILGSGSGLQTELVTRGQH